MTIHRMYFMLVQQGDKFVTGSVGSIKGSDLNRVPSGNVDQLLQGKIAGVQVIAPSGQPGASATIRVRGYGSRSDANALVVVDGIPLGDAGDIKQVNPMAHTSILAVTILVTLYKLPTRF